MGLCVRFINIWDIVKGSFSDTMSKQAKYDTIINQYQKQLKEIEPITDEAATALAKDIYKNLFTRGLLPQGIKADNIKEKVLQKESLPQEDTKVNGSNLVDITIKQSPTALKNSIIQYFGVQDVGDDVKNEFIQKFTQTVIWDPETGQTPNSEDELNIYIRNFQQSLYDDVVAYLSKDGVKVPDTLFNSDKTNNFHSVYEFMENVLDNTSPFAIKQLKENPTRNNTLKLEAIKSYFKLRYFDSFVASNFKDTFQLRAPSFSGKLSMENKYVFNIKTDQQQATDWFNVDKRSPKDIMSKRIQNLFGLIPYVKYGVVTQDRLSSDEVSYAIREVKNSLLTRRGQKISVKHNGVIQDYNFTKQEKVFLNKYLKDRKEANLEHVMAITRNNIVDGYSILFKVLKNNLKQLRLTQQASNNIDSLQRYVFDDSSNKNVLKVSSPQLYKDLVHILDYTSDIPTSRYKTNEYDQWGVEEMSPLSSNAVEGQLKESINSLYDPISVEVLSKKYQIEENYDTEHPENSYITFKIDNSDKPNMNSYFVQVYTHQNSGKKEKVVIRREQDNSKISKYDNTDFNSLLGFIKDTLGDHLGKNESLKEELFRHYGNVDNVLKNIIPLASTTLSVAKLVRSFDVDGLIPDKETYQTRGKNWGLISFDKDGEQNIRYFNGYEGYDVIHTGYLDQIQAIAKCKAMANRAYSRSVMRTSEGTNIPVSKLTHVNADRRTAIVSQIETNNSALKIGDNKYITDGIAGWSTSREAKYSSGGKQNVYFNFTEHLFSSFCIDFLTGFSKNGKHYNQFTEATVSDKPQTPKIQVLGLDQLTTKGIRDLIVRDFGKFYLNVWKNIKNDLDTLQQFLNNNPIEYKGITLDDSLSIDYENNFYNFNAWVKNHSTDNLKLSGGDVLNKICLEYNKLHRFNPIEIDENVHKRNNSDDIELNKGFISELMRFNRADNLNLKPELQELNYLSNLWKSKSLQGDGYWWSQQNPQKYFDKNDLRLVDDLISNRAHINIFHDSGHVIGQTWAQKLDEVGNHIWRKSNGDVIFARIKLNNGKEIAVSNSFDLIGFVDEHGNTSDNAKFNFESLQRQELNNIKSITVHPYLRKWNVADYYYTNKSTLGTVGASFWCDAKKFKNTDYEVESAQKDHQKRSVTMTATMNQFILGALDGIAHEANVVVFKQPSDEVYTITGDTGEVEYWDGATFTSAFQHYWENASLANAITGYTKKPIMHFYNERFGLAQLNKTASFAITNDLMRFSFLHQKLHYKSTNGVWLDNNGQYLRNADITKDFKGNAINFSDCYYQVNGNYYQIAKIERVPNYANINGKKYGVNTYRIEATPVDYKGDPLEGETNREFYKKIDSNYRFWEALGGLNSLSKKNGRLELSENSIEKVAKVACMVGIDLLNDVNTPPKEFEAPTSQAGLFQFMKHSDKHYLVTDGAFKKAPGNLNSTETLTNDEDFNFIRVNMTYSGTQLDPTHHADNATVALMTQVMSALADRGYTKELADQVYSALGDIAREELEPFYNSYRVLLNTKSKDEIVNLISGQILDSFKGSKINSDNLLETISLKLYNLVQERGRKNINNENLKGIIPWSENSVSALINSTVTSTINKLAIRLKTFGTLSVLNPSHGIAQLYNDRKLSDYTSAYDFYQQGVKMWDNKITGHNFRLGRYYRYKDQEGNIHNVKMRLSNYYDFIKNFDSGLYTDVSETYLGKETVLYQDDQSSISLDKPYFGLVKYYRTQEDEKNDVAVYEFSNRVLRTDYLDENGERDENGDVKRVPYYKAVAVELLGRELDTYSIFINDGEYSAYDLKSVHDKVKLNADYKRLKKLQKELRSYSDPSNLYDEELEYYNNLVAEVNDLQVSTDNFKEKIHQLNREIQKDFVRIHNKQEVAMYNAVDDTVIPQVQINNHEEHAFGVMLPMIYKTKLGLREGDVIADIVNDKDFFFRRLLQNYYEQDTRTSPVLKENYDIILRRINGNNIYIKLKDGKLIDNSKLSVLDIKQSYDQNGNLWREDQDRNPIYRLSSKSDVIYQDNQSINKGEVIFTDADGIKFYIDQFKNDIFDIQVKNTKDVRGTSKENGEYELSSYHKNLEKIILGTKYAKDENITSIRRFLFNWSNQIIDYALKGKSLEESDLIRQLTSDSKNYKLKELYKQARRTHTAFLRSLQELAARIPSQGMASFMTMRTEAFTNIDVNNCYVSDMQLELQGSDMDVDKVTMMGCSFSNGGKYIKWSRFMFDDSIEALNITSGLKFPTGKNTTIIDRLNPIYESRSRIDDIFNAVRQVYNNDEELSIQKYAVLFDEKGRLNLRKDKKESTDGKLTTEFDDNAYDLNKLELLVEMINKYNIKIQGVRKSPLRDNIEKVVNQHNHTEFGNNKDDALSNLVQYVGSKISLSILNAVASQQGTDEVSEPLKQLADQSSFGTKDYQNRYGNAAVKIIQVITNQTGKSGIAITASVGIKSFFAITQYFNMKLNQAKSPEEILKYTFDVEVDGKHYRTLANINIDESILKDWEESDNVDLREVAKSIRENDKIDADTTISGTMTLAVDNAKELKLAKLNASSEILGLYLYGISIGVPFEKLVSIFTSNVADVLNQNISGNVFLNEDDIRLGTAIRRLKQGPPIRKEIVDDEKSLINKENILFDNGIKYKSIADMLLGEDGFINQAATLYEPTKKDYLAKRRVFIVKKLSELKNKLGNLYRNQSSTEFDKKLVNRAYRYIDQIYRMYANGEIEKTNQVLKDIETLYGGKKEYSMLKNLILNQGVAVLENEQLTWLNTFSNVIKAKLGSSFPTSEIIEFRDNYNDGSLLIDILKYTIDDEYKKAAINAYESIKHTVNILDVIDNLPHFQQYLKGYGASIIAKLNSVKYQAKMKLQDQLFNIYGAVDNVDKERMLKRLDYFLTGVLYNQFLKGPDVPNVNIQAGTTLIIDGQAQTLEKPIKLQLGTDIGNTNFKLWVENTVVPDLQNMTLYNRNSFISDLIPKRYKNTQFGNLIRSITLPVDMIPKSDSDIQRLRRYAYDFSVLNKGYRDSGLTVQEIFYLYNMITYQNRNNTKALTPITDTLYTSNDSIAAKAQRFISMFDSESSLVYDKVNLNDSSISNFFTKDDLIRAVAPSTGEVNYKYFEGPYLRMFNYKTLQWELLERIPDKKENESEQEVNSENNYGEVPDVENYGEQNSDNSFGDVPNVVDQDQDADTDFDNFDQDNNNIKQNEKENKVKDIKKLFVTVFKSNQLGETSRVQNVLGKLQSSLPEFQEFITLDTEDATYINNNTYIDINAIDPVKNQYLVTVHYNNEGTSKSFNVQPRIINRIVENSLTPVIDRLDLEVKINKKVRELLNQNCP